MYFYIKHTRWVMANSECFYAVERLLGRFGKAWPGFHRQKGWVWGRLRAVQLGLDTWDLVPVGAMEFKQRAGVKTCLGLFQCTSSSIKGHNVSNSCKNIYYCPAQEPDFQVRTMEANFRKALQYGLGGRSRWHHKEETIQFREKKL